MLRSKWVAAAMAVALVLGAMAMPVLADDNTPPPMQFRDMDDTPWALSAVAAMSVLGIVKGDGMGHFRPADTVTREEAIALAIRNMGLEGQANSLDITTITINITDFAMVDDWARADVVEAMKLGLLPPPDANGKLEPTAPATRLWAAIMLDKALGFDAKAQANMNARVPFADADQIPQSAVGFVYAAADQGLFNGIPGDDGRIFFRADGAVTRAQIAVLLNRSDDQLPFTPERAASHRMVINGRVTATDAAKGTITVDHHGNTTTYTLAGNACVFVNEQLCGIGMVQVGMKVKLDLNAQGLVVLVSAKEAMDRDKDKATRDHNDDRLAVEGRFVGAVNNQVTLLVRDTQQTLNLADKFTVMIKGQTVSLSDIAVGANVNAMFDAAGKVVCLDANDPARADDRDWDSQHQTATGMISAITMGSGTPPQVALEITSRVGVKVSYALASNVKIESGDKVITVADLKVGDMVSYKLDGSTVVELRVLMHG